MDSSHVDTPGMVFTIKNSLNHYEDSKIAFKVCGEKSRTIEDSENAEKTITVLDRHCFYMSDKDFVPYNEEKTFFVPAAKIDYLVGFSDDKENIAILFNDTHFKSVSYWKCWDQSTINISQKRTEIKLTQINKISYSCKVR